MILTRVGNKRAIAKKIIPLFPPHKAYIEPFFGAGGMFFSKPLAKYNMVNDLDSDVFNLFMVLKERKGELKKAFEQVPIHEDLLRHWMKNKETDPLQKALRFLFLSNLTYLGKGDCLSYTLRENPKARFLKYVDQTFELCKEVRFNNCDFRRFFESLSFIDVDYGKPSNERENAFIYADPPYLSTTRTYEGFTPDDVVDLFDCLEKTGCKWAYSEFDHPFILEQAKERGHNVHIIGERQNLKNRRTEILVTNYEVRQEITLFESL